MSIGDPTPTAYSPTGSEAVLHFPTLFVVVVTDQQQRVM